jgi:hypothetical protein
MVVVFVVDALLATLFPVVYAVLAPWRATALGRHFLAYTATVAGLMNLSVLSIFWRPPAWVWLAGYIALGALLAHRLWLFYKVQRGSLSESTPRR